MNDANQESKTYLKRKKVEIDFVRMNYYKLNKFIDNSFESVNLCVEISFVPSPYSTLI